MKKIALALLLLPAVSFAENINFIGAQYTWMSGISDEEKVDGYMVGYERVFGDGFAAALDYIVLDTENKTLGTKDRHQEVNASVDFAFIGSFKTGAVYIGLEKELYNGSNNKYLTKVGVATRSGEGLDFDFNISTRHGDIGLGGSMRGQLSDGIMGWELGFTHVLNKTTSFAGLSLAF